MIIINDVDDDDTSFAGKDIRKKASLFVVLNQNKPTRNSKPR